MADQEESNHHRITDSPSPPPLGMRHQSTLDHGGCGEIVEVEGGHIVRSTGKKDRHSKVCTAKGPRDRRVRLSAPTAIQFYDVQDRLGFDRPSKAVDWLIKKAKSAIDDLAELPPWNPADTLRQAAASKPKRPKTVIPPAEMGIHGGSGEETEHHQLSFLPASVSTPRYHQPPSRANAQAQDLRLSLHSFQKAPPFADETEHALFSGQSNPLVFDSSTASWDQSQQNHRLATLNNGGAADSAASGGGGFVFASPAATTSFQTQSQVFSQRGPLQSINTPMLRAWFDPYHHHHHQSITTNDHHHHHHHHHPYHQQDDHGDKPSSASSDSRHSSNW